MKEFDVVVAGAGIWGCTIARRIAETGKRVLVLEKRGKIGGNCACEIDPETGIEIHTYGSHIFHTKSEKVWNFIRRFTDFNDYRHCVLANHAGRIYHLPFGRTLYDEFFGEGNYELPLNDKQNEDVFDAFIRGYTSKQWGVPPEKVDPSVIARLKVRDNYSTDYFDDPYQGIPLEGYNKMFERMLDHPNVTVQCNCELTLNGDKMKVRGEGEERINQAIEQSNNRTIYYSGPIDALFGYKFGALPWRSLRFETEKLSVMDYQHNSVVNYPDVDVPYTRIHEFRHYHPEWQERAEGQQRTIIMREFSKAWELGDEPYYPIANSESAVLFSKYQGELARCNQTIKQSVNLTIVCGGRLGCYRYYDMDRAMSAALEEPLNS